MAVPRKVAVAGGTGKVGSHVVDVLRERGHDAVPMSRAGGVDILTGRGLADALDGVECIIDTIAGPTAEERAASAFFRAASRNLHEAGARAGVQRMAVVSVIGSDRFTAGYGRAVIAHEEAAQSGPIPARVLRSAQFHELVAQLVDAGTSDDEVRYIPEMLTQIVAARSVAEALVDLVTDASTWTVAGAAAAPIGEIAGPRVEQLVDLATLLVAYRGDVVKIEGVSNSNPDDPDRGLYEAGALLPGPDAVLAGPTYEEWLDSTM